MKNNEELKQEGSATDPEDKKQEEKQQPLSPENSEDHDDAEENDEQISEEPLTESERLQKQYDELYDKYIRLMSEFDNYRKRTRNEREQLIKTAAEGMILDLLPVMDDLERALLAYTENDEDVPEGFQLIYEKFRRVLKSKGLEEIKATGETFDSEYHEAITKMQAPSKKLKGCVIDQVQKGYTLNGKIVRHAKVIVGA